MLILSKEEWQTSCAIGCDGQYVLNRPSLALQWNGAYEEAPLVQSHIFLNLVAVLSMGAGGRAGHLSAYYIQVRINEAGSSYWQS